MSLIKNSQEIDIIIKGGKILSDVLDLVIKEVRPGISTKDLDVLAEKLIIDAGGVPSFKNYGNPPYPCSLCTSINSELVHGIARENRILKDGDIISLDIGMRYPADNGLYTDMAKTVAVGIISSRAQELLAVTKKSLEIVEKELKAGIDLQEIARKMQTYIERAGFGVVRDLVGHGVGHKVHEEPQVPNFVIPNFHFIVKEGMVLAFEPMVSLGNYAVETKEDNWTVETIDKSLTAHFEHTFIVTNDGNIVATK